MPGLKVSAIVFVAALLLTFGLAAIGNVMPPPAPAQRATYATVGMAAFFTLFLVMGFSAIPVAVHLVLGGAALRGDAGVHLSVRTQAAIVWTLWTIIAIGLTVALPFAAKDGFFGSAAARRADSIFNGKGQARQRSERPPQSHR